MAKRQTWGKHAIWHPCEAIYPTSLEELRRIVEKARGEHAKMRVAGSLHSLNLLCATSGIQIHTDKLCRVLVIDKTQRTVKVESGIKIKKLLEMLAKENLTLPNQGYIVEQSVAGAIATATHGSGKTGTFSSFIQEIELLDANGRLHQLTPNTDPHLFSAAVVNLGCLGIVYSVTLKCIPLEKLHLTKAVAKLATLASLPDLLTKYDYFQFILNPYSDDVLIWHYQKTKENIHHRWLFKLNWLLIKLLAVISFDFLKPPYWLMPLNIKIYMKISPFKSCVDYSYQLLSPADEGHYIEEEIAIPLNHLEKALTVTRNLVDRYSQKKIRPVAVILVRFANPDEFGYLSPALRRDTAYISLIAISKSGYRELFKEFEISLYQFEGRPHWGKAHSLTKERIESLYGDNYARFKEARRELDPEGLFANEYIETLFL